MICNLGDPMSLRHPVDSLRTSRTLLILISILLALHYILLTSVLISFKLLWKHSHYSSYYSHYFAFYSHYSWYYSHYCSECRVRTAREARVERNECYSHYWTLLDFIWHYWISLVNTWYYLTLRVETLHLALLTLLDIASHITHVTWRYCSHYSRYLRLLDVSGWFG